MRLTSLENIKETSLGYINARLDGIEIDVMETSAEFTPALLEVIVINRTNKIKNCFPNRKVTVSAWQRKALKADYQLVANCTL